MRVIHSTRFGEIQTNDIIQFQDGILGFENMKEWVLVDPNDSTGIVWLQCCENPGTAYPLIPSRIIDKNAPDDHFYNLMIPSEFKRMTANTKAPIIISGKEGAQIIQSGGEVQTPAFDALRKNAMGQG